jgi:hypothetical protein
MDLQCYQNSFYDLRLTTRNPGKEYNAYNVANIEINAHVEPLHIVKAKLLPSSGNNVTNPQSVAEQWIADFFCVLTKQVFAGFFTQDIIILFCTTRSSLHAGVAAQKI